MGFTSQLFVFIFAPFCFMAYFVIHGLEKVKGIGNFIKEKRIKDIVLIMICIVFYAFAFAIDVIKLLLLVVFIYSMAKVIEKKREHGSGFTVLKVAVIVLVLGLIYFKYTEFLSYNITRLFMDNPVTYSVMAPLGISFITFSAISYVVDVYRKDAKAGSFIDCLLFITFFPKVISGPIVLWKDFSGQINNRVYSVDCFEKGIRRIITGFAKKAILADTFGFAISEMTIGSIDQVTAVGSLFIYMLQIYYDFSGYSDIAIGLSNILGFDFSENFNFPYRSKSISEFWRRWHISLGTWFRQYIYFPLGGSRKGKFRTLVNLGVVFALTGIWHGAGWTYILWGAINGVIVIVEHMIKDKEFYKKIPDFVKYTVTMLIVLCFWQFFRCYNLSEVATVLKTALGIEKATFIPYTWKYFFDLRMIVFMIIGTLGATVLGSSKLKEKYNKFACTKIGCIVQETGLVLLLIVSLMFVVSATYSPFIYFQY